MYDDVREVAEKAYKNLLDGFQTGDWEPFLGMLDDEVDCILPAPNPGRQFSGAEGRQQMVGFFTQFTAGSAHFGETEIIGTTVAADRVVFEDWARGTVFGEPYAARHCIHMMVRDGKIVGFHEYNRPLD